MEIRLVPRAKAILLWASVALGLVLLLRAPHILSPFVWAFVTAYVLQPAVSAIARVTRLPRPVVAVVLYFALMAAAVLALIALFPILRAQAIGLVNQLPGTVEWADEQLQTRYPDLVDWLGLDTTALQRQLYDLSNQWTAAAPRTALTVVQQLVGFVIELFVYLIATFYLLLQGQRIVADLRKLMPGRHQREVDQLLGEINSTLGAYLRGQLLLVIIMSTSTYAALTIYGVQYAAVLALATGCLELIPIIGPWSAGAIAVSVAALQPTTPFGWSHVTLAVVVGVTYFVLRQLEDNLIIPWVIGRIIHLHPLVMIFVLLVGTKFGGALGLLLAVPLAAVLKIVFAYVYSRAGAEEERKVLLLDSRDDFADLLGDLPGLASRRVVLLPQPGVLAWDDLPLVHRLAAESNRCGVNLSVVTQDPVTGSLTTAVGIPTTILPAPSPPAVAAPLPLEQTPA